MFSRRAFKDWQQLREKHTGSKLWKKSIELQVKVKKKSAHTCGIPCFVVGLQGTGWKSKPENSVVAPASTKPDSFATCTALQLIRLRRRRRRRRRRKLYCCRALFRGRSNSNGAFHR
jgi:hypothetical protein